MNFICFCYVSRAAARCHDIRQQTGIWNNWLLQESCSVGPESERIPATGNMYATWPESGINPPIRNNSSHWAQMNRLSVLGAYIVELRIPSISFLHFIYFHCIWQSTERWHGNRWPIDRKLWSARHSGYWDQCAEEPEPGINIPIPR